MANTISISNLAKELEKEFKNYSDDVFETVKKDLTKSTKECVNDVKANAKSAGIPNDTGYCDDWKSKTLTENNAKRRFSKVIYSPKHYRIAHLLEHGHAKVNGGRVAGRPHIIPAQEKAEKRTLELIANDLRGV